MSEKLTELISYLDSLTARVDLAKLKNHLENVDIKRSDVETLCIFGDDTYKRNLISQSKWYELLVMCWRPGQRSQIHDHGHSACGVKVIEGTLTETRFKETNPGLVSAVDESIYQPQAICVRIDSDIHEMSNFGETDLITLHIYSPMLKMTLYKLDDSTTSHSRNLM